MFMDITHTGFPFVVKSPHQGSSIGVVLCETKEVLEADVKIAVRRIRKYVAELEEWMHYCLR
jgi:D-alanine-D-alanine ligase-like ATP-grasp enzyme